MGLVVRNPAFCASEQHPGSLISTFVIHSLYMFYKSVFPEFISLKSDTHYLSLVTAFIHWYGCFHQECISNICRVLNINY